MPGFTAKIDENCVEHMESTLRYVEDNGRDEACNCDPDSPLSHLRQTYHPLLTPSLDYYCWKTNHSTFGVADRHVIGEIMTIEVIGV